MRGFGTWKWHILINTSRQLCATVELFWNILYEPLQSAYKKFHGLKTALKKVDSDIVTAIDSGHSVILVLLDLSAAFDTVDHTILTRRLSTRFGIRGRVLDWFVSYLSDRAQYTKVNDTSSNSLYRFSFGSDIEFFIHFSKQHQMNNHFYDHTTVPLLQRTLMSLSIMALSMVPHITVVCKSVGFFSPA